MVVSDFIVRELEEKLVSKARLARAEAAEVVGAVKADAEVIRVSALPDPICRDPDDDWMLATALQAKANVIVTGDDDLLILKSFKGIPIVTPRSFLELLHRKVELFLS